MSTLAEHFPTGNYHQPDETFAGECSCGHTFYGASYAASKQAWAAHALAALAPAAIASGQTQDPLDWLNKQHNVSLSYHYPWRCDDEDQDEEWRVTRENGGVNDREWTVIGTGKTAREALVAAIASGREGAE
ncbi:hypothetical protein [Sphingomonas sp. TREG-RG-20F-R18-01]|uniref:hypothetical protein n=1 Tax=Sphingomonas sp. TREG-RG-20F-R18-01 TaxID=2914982 RepID=UPI001F57A9DF|nr:hypothetical protein [Sphingomonas sp. TREG-RG-20F-R18-01]